MFKYLFDDLMFKFVGKFFEVVLGVFIEIGKVKNLWFNVDVYSGVLF